MKNLVALSLLAIMSGLPTAFSQEAQPYSIAIKAVKPTVSAGEDVWVSVTLQNSSMHSIDCTTQSVAGVDRSFKYEVKDANGKSRERIDLHPEKYAGSYQLCTLKPGESVTHETRVSWLHDVTQPGTYTVQLSRYVSAGVAVPVITSNTIVITVTPKKKEVDSSL